MRPLSLAILTLACLGSLGWSAPAEDLFPARDFAGWALTATPDTAVAAVCEWRADGVIAVTGRPVGFLATTASYANFRLHAEWRWPGQPGNSGVLVHISSGAVVRGWPLCFQIQTKFKAAGDLLPMAGATFAEALTSAPGAVTAVRAHTAPDSEKPAGEWNTCDVTCQGGAIQVTINGVLQNTVSHAIPASGRIGFQLEGTPFELRRVSVVRLD